MKTLNTTPRSFRRLLAKLAVLAAASVYSTLAQNGTWETKTPMLEGRIQSAGVSVGGLFYVFGGSTGNCASTTPEVYDSVADTWSFRAADLIPRSVMSAGVINNKVYVVGGWVCSDSNEPTSALEIYDPITDSWTIAAPMSIERGSMGSGVINGKLYVTGGMGRRTWFSQTEIYDPLSDSWSTGAPLPLPVFAAGAAVMNGKLYVVGGTIANFAAAVGNVQIYDPVSDTWTSGAPLPTPRGLSVVAVLNGEIYAVGVQDNNNISTVEIYDPVSNTWASGTPAPRAISSSASSVIDSKLYVAGGYSFPDGFPPSAALSVFTPGANRPPVAICKNVTVLAGADCAANASIDNGSYDPDSGDTITLSQSPAGPYALGTTMVMLTVTDNHGAASSCSATVTVVDTTPPNITCPANISAGTDPGQCSAVVNYTVRASDNCGTAKVVCSPPSGSSFAKGTTTVNCTATDGSGNQSSCSFTVTVNDTEKPTITCPANIAVGCSADLLTPVDFSATATDNCDPNPIVAYSQAPGSGFAIGTTVVTCTATDASGNQSSCTFTVTRAPLDFTGFLSPVGGADTTGGSFANPLRTFKMGSTVPVKFAASCGGAPVLTGTHTLQAIKYSDATSAGTPLDATARDSATTGDQFRLADGHWQFNLDTKGTGMSAGIWQLVATVSDGSQHMVWIQLK